MKTLLDRSEYFFSMNIGLDSESFCSNFEILKSVSEISFSYARDLFSSDYALKRRGLKPLEVLMVVKLKDGSFHYYPALDSVLSFD